MNGESNQGQPGNPGHTAIAAGVAVDKKQDGQPPAQEAPAPPPPSTGHHEARTWILAGVGIVVGAAALYFGIPFVWLMFTTISTDDAYVNGHVTFVAARVSGQVVKVLVDDNYRVKKDDWIVQLDEEPYQVQVNLKNAILASAKSDYDVASAQVRGMVAQARSQRFKLEHAMENVNNQVAQLRATVAVLDSDLAKRDRTKKDLDRIRDLMKTPGAATQQDFDLKLQDYLVAKAVCRQALEGVYQIRAGLGLPTKLVNVEEITQAPQALADAPADLDQTFSTVRQAAAELLQTAAPLGVYSSSFDLTPKQILEEFLKRDPQENIDRIYAKVIKDAPTLKQAETKVVQAQRDLDQALLNLRYCKVLSEIDGVVTRRNVNPGNNIQAGQSLMAVRSLTEIWIDANFKETQLADLRIGQHAKIEVDMYGSRREYDGRITGFTMGTGQTLSLLPPQNATGNFVKIVQRLPVKIELNNYDPDKEPLFVGLSCTPYVYFKEPPKGPDAGKVLQPPR